MSILQPFNSDGGFSTAGNVTAANVVATTLYGDGGNITGITVSGGNEILNGNSNVIIPTADGNINFNTTDGLGNTWSWQMDVNGNLVLPRNTAANSSITTATGTNGSITIHPDGGGKVYIKGDNAELVTIFSDTVNNPMKVVVQSYGNGLGNIGGGAFVGSYRRGNNTPVQAGDRLVALQGRGSYDGNTYAGNPGGAIAVYADGTWTNSSQPTYISFLNTLNNSNAAVENMRIEPNGNVTVFNGNIISQGAYVTGLDDAGINAGYFGVPGFTPITSNVILQVAGNVNSYGQINFQNINTGSQSSTDIIVTADNGGDTTHYFDMGIAGGNWDGTQPNSLGTALSAGDGYLWNQDGNVKIATTVGTNTPFVWNFDTVGNLTLPGNTFSVNYANGTPVTLGGGGSLYANTVASFGTDFGIGPNYNTNDPSVLFGSDDVVIRTGGTANVGSQNFGELYLAGSEDAYFGQAGNLVDATYPSYNTSVFANSTAITINTPNAYTWTYNNNGTLSLATTNVSGSTGESALLVGTRRVVNGVYSGAQYAYSATLAAGGTPTVAYTATNNSVESVKVTFAVQSNGAGFQWEQFDVVAVQNQDTPGQVNVVVSNRVKAAAGIGDTQVTAVLNGSNQIQISLNLDAAQTSGGNSSFDAVEFGLMVD